MIKIAIIGGTGLDNPEILNNSGISEIDTPYGKTSSSFTSGKIGGVDVMILARHGREHTISPTNVNNRANIWAIKELGCTHILATTACGSLREEIGRGDIVIPNQFIDFTRHRDVTFFESFKSDNLKHTPMSDPFNEKLRNSLIIKAKQLCLKLHPAGTVITIEGPRFSTRAESHMFRAWGADVINMSTAPECILANELEIPYAAVAMSTDYDCWKKEEVPVTWEEVLKVFSQNVNNVIDLLKDTISDLGNTLSCYTSYNETTTNG